METLIIYPQSKEQLQALKAIAKPWKIDVETSPYDPSFLTMIKKAEKGVIIKTLIRMTYGAV